MAMLLCATCSFAQQRLVTMHLRHATLEQAIKTIEKHTSVQFYYRNSIVAPYRNINYSCVNEDIEFVISQLLTPRGLTYTMSSPDVIVIQKKPKATSATTFEGTVDISGTVSDRNGARLMGATISSADGQTMTISDMDGRFRLSASPGESLTVSYIGFVTRKVVAAQKMHIILEDDINTIDNIVVLGYGVARRKNVSASIEHVEASELRNLSPTSVGQILRSATVAGLNVYGSSNAPDGKTSMRLRGIGTINNSASPLFVVDGIIVDDDISHLNPYDVESIDILKDASATAIYGAQGANGVIIITTRTGKAGETRTEFNANYGISIPYKGLDVLDVEHYAKAIRTGHANDGTMLMMPIWGEQYDSQRKNIRWQDEVQRTSTTQNYNMNVSAGIDKYRGTVSANYINNDGTLVNSGHQRMTLHTKVLANVNHYLEVGGNINFSHIRSQVNSGTLLEYAICAPTMDYTDDDGRIVSPNVVNADGTYGTFKQSSTPIETGTNTDNPYAARMEAGYTYRYNIFSANMYAEVRLLKHFRWRTLMSYSSKKSDIYSWTPTLIRSNAGTEMVLDRTGNVSNRTFILTQASLYKRQADSYITFEKNTRHHAFSVTEGASMSSQKERWAGANAVMPYENLRDVSLVNSSNNLQAYGSFNTTINFLSYFTRAMWSYNHKYNLTATLRYDGCSNFNKSNRWGVFPAFAASWIVSEEDFLHRYEWLSNLKLRVGWGRTGNAGKATSNAVAQITNTDVSYNFYGNGSSTQQPIVKSGLATTILADPALKWETNEQTNFGIDLGLMDNRLTLSADYFVRTTRDLLLDKSIRTSLGSNSMYTNFGKIRNQGLELRADYYWIKNGDAVLRTAVECSTLRNKIVSCGDDIISSYNINQGLYWSNCSICREGYAVGSYYGYVSDGLFTNQDELDALNAKARAAGSSDGYQHSDTSLGDIKYKDLNGDGHIDYNDMTVLGNGIPKLDYGFTLQAKWRNWDLTAIFYGELGKKILSYSAMRTSVLTMSNSFVANITNDAYRNAWSTDNAGGTFPRLSIDDPNHNSRCSDYWLRTGDFLKMHNLQIGYTIASRLVRWARIQNIRLSLTANNLFYITPYRHGSPESTDSILYNGLDTGSYPQSSSIVFGLSVNL